MPIPKMNFGVLVNNTFDVFQRDIVVGITDTATKNGFQAKILTVPNRENPEVNTQGLAGLVVVANCVSDDYLRTMYQNGMPISLVSHQLPDLPLPVLSPDNFEGIQLLVEHLVVDCHCSRIVFIQGDLNQKDGIKRDMIFRREMLRYNLEIIPDFVIKGDFIPHVAREAFQTLVNHRLDFDAVLASDYLMGLEALDILHQQDVSIPENVCVVGFGDAPEAEQAGLTTVAADVIELGRRAARQVIGQIEGLLIRGTTLISADLIRRNTSR